MDPQTKGTLITVIASILTSGVTAFAVVAFRMGRYSEKIDQLEKCNLNTRLSTLEGRQLTKRNSPVTLTEFGQRLVENSHSKDFIDENYEELKRKVEESGPKTSYDIQEGSREVILGLKDDDRISVIKDYLFREGMDFEEIVGALGIYLRDKILSEQGVELDDVDRHDPQKAEK